MPLNPSDSKATMQRTCLACGEEVDLKTAVPIRKLRESSRISIDRLVRESLTIMHYHAKDVISCWATCSLMICFFHYYR